MHLVAANADDVRVLSALMQDAIIRPADCAQDARARRFVMFMTRYCHEAGTPQRVRAALRIDQLRAVQHKGFAGDAPQVLLALEALEAQDNETSTKLMARFAGGAALRLECETIDLMLDDLSEPWSTDKIPSHP
jgi:Protein of unknown function (DUF2948)